MQASASQKGEHNLYGYRSIADQSSPWNNLKVGDTFTFHAGGLLWEDAALVDLKEKAGTVLTTTKDKSFSYKFVDDSAKILTTALVTVAAAALSSF